MKIPKPHCSTLDRIDACPGSILPGEGPDGGPAQKEAGGLDAIAGRANHEADSYVAQGIDPPTAEIAAKYGVDQDGIDLSVRLARKAWGQIGIYFPNPLIEYQVESEVCVGRLDVGAVVQSAIDGEPPLAIRVNDWKTGWGDDEHPCQLKGYALGMVAKFGWPQNGVVTVFETWTSHQRIKTDNVTREELNAFRKKIAGIMRTAETDPEALEYRAGSHCRWCPHRADCPTRDAWLRDATTALVAIDHGREITLDTIGRAYLKYVEVKRACYQFERLIKAALEDGPIPLPDGREVRYVESEREKIGAAAAMKALADRIPREDWAEILGDVSKKAIDAWAKANSAKGKKAALIREIFAELREGEAIRTVPYREAEAVAVESEG